VDNDKDYINEFSAKLKSPDHSFHHVEDWDDITMLDSQWDVVFIDCAPARARTPLIEKARSCCKFIVVHDTELPDYYSYEPTLSSFPHMSTCKWQNKWVTILSMTESLREFDLIVGDIQKTPMVTTEPKKEVVFPQSRVSEGLKGFSKKFYAHFDIPTYFSQDEPCLFYGCYHKVGDVDTIVEHRGPKVVVWSGSDAAYTKGDVYDPLREVEDIIHVATSECVRNELINSGFHKSDPIVVPIFLCDKERWNPVPLGNKVYVFAHKNNNWLYNVNLTKYVMSKMPDIEFITVFPPMPQEQWAVDPRELYKQCAVGLRLTRTDGISHTSVELGLMGRKCIWNGSLPNAIYWHTVDDIMQAIRREVARAGETDSALAQKVSNHIVNGKECLRLDFYQKIAEKHSQVT